MAAVSGFWNELPAFHRLSSFRSVRYRSAMGGLTLRAHLSRNWQRPARRSLWRFARRARGRGLAIAARAAHSGGSASLDEEVYDPGDRFQFVAASALSMSFMWSRISFPTTFISLVLPRAPGHLRGHRTSVRRAAHESRLRRPLARPSFRTASLFRVSSWGLHLRLDFCRLGKVNVDQDVLGSHLIAEVLLRDNFIRHAD